MNANNFQELLASLGGSYAFYQRDSGAAPVFLANADRFSSASIIKVPILLAWAFLERAGEINLEEPCNLDAEPQVTGAGFARVMHSRQLSYHDVLLMMIATSDNLCTNLAIRRVGMERLNAIFHDELGLPGCELQRKLMDFAARARGLDNWISARDCIHLFDLVRALPAQQKSWVETMLLCCQDTSLLMRNLESDSVDFYHKTGSISGVRHDWGYTRSCDIFLLTNGFRDEHAAVEVFGQLGILLRNTSP